MNAAARRYDNREFDRSPSQSVLERVSRRDRVVDIKPLCTVQDHDRPLARNDDLVSILYSGEAPDAMRSETKRMQGISMWRALEARLLPCLVCAFVGASFAVCAQQKWEPVTPKEIREKIVGTVQQWNSVDGRSGTLLLRPEGKIEFRTESGPRGPRVDEGTWRTSETALCTSYPQFRQGQEDCFEIIRLADGSYEYYLRGRFDGRMTPR